MVLIVVGIAAIALIDVFLGDHAHWMDPGMVFVIDVILAILYFVLCVNVLERRERSKGEWVETPEMEKHKYDHSA